MNGLIGSDKYYAIVGVGLTGLSIARYLSRLGKRFCILDSRESPPMLDDIREIVPQACIGLGTLDLDTLLNAEEIYISPGLSRKAPEIQRALKEGKNIVGDVELFLREIRGFNENLGFELNAKNIDTISHQAKKVVGVTGSNGKSTVVSMLGKAAEEAGMQVGVGGNIGIPVLDLLEREADMFILELSSFQLESMSRPMLDVACVLNVSEDHMDRYDSMAEYCIAKQKIYWGARNVVYNYEDKLTIPPRVEQARYYGFGYERKLEESEIQYCFDTVTHELKQNDTVLMNRAQIKVPGSHNVNNALAVFAICDAVGIPRQACVKMLQKFKGLPHRCEWVMESDGVTYINDSKATNVGAADVAVKSLGENYRPLVLLVGGDGKGADFTTFVNTINKYVSFLIVIGVDGKKIAENLDSHIGVHYASDMKNAVESAGKQCAPGGAVLLSPACASFDRYQSYEERGAKFISAVKQLCA